MPGQVSTQSWQDRATWWRLLLTVCVVLVAFFVVPLAHWWTLPLLVWVYVRALPRWVPVWFQWGVVVFLSAQMAVVSGWSWGASLALFATTVAAVYWEGTAQQLSWRVVQEVALASAWLVLAFMSGQSVWWEANVILLLLVVARQVYRQGR